MSDFNQKHNRAVWFDIPVIDLARASQFYRQVLAIDVQQQSFENFQFAVLEHEQGNGGCLVPNPDDVGAHGIMVYFNAEGRLAEAVAEVTRCGGTVQQDIHAIGPHGFRAIVIDSEGNRIVLHSQSSPDQT